jgi:ribokinase
MNVAVIGHIEWGRFVHVDHVPKSGEIIHAEDEWEEVAGGGSVAAMQLAKLNGNCLFFTAIGNDELGTRAVSQLQKSGVEVFASVQNDQPTKSIFVDVDSHDERTITVVGSQKPSGLDASLPWGKLASMDAIYFVSGDEAALKLARQAKTLVSTARILPLLQSAAIQLDALVTSSKDGGEAYRPGELTPVPKLVVTTKGVEGGTVDSGVTYESEIVSEDELVDTYGCGDSFAAGLTFGLGQTSDLEEALRVAAHSGAEAAKRRGAFGN